MASVCLHQDQERSGVSRTAHAVAAWRWTESKSKSPLFIDPFAEALAGDVGKEVVIKNEFNNGRTTTDLESLVAVRTKKIDDELINALKRNLFHQVCVIGAGLDTRAFRIPSYSTHKMKYFEIDFKEIFNYKLEVLKSMGANSEFEYHAVETDLSLPNWFNDLLSAGFDPNQSTFWIMEGLMNYLTEDECSHLMNCLVQLSSLNSQIVSTSMSAGNLQLGNQLHRFKPVDPLQYFNKFGWRGKQFEMTELCEEYNRTIAKESGAGYFIINCYLTSK